MKLLLCYSSNIHLLSTSFLSYIHQFLLTMNQLADSTSDSDSNTSTSWIFVGGNMSENQSEAHKYYLNCSSEPVQELTEKCLNSAGSEIETDSDGISIISESDENKQCLHTDDQSSTSEEIDKEKIGTIEDLSVHLKEIVKPVSASSENSGFVGGCVLIGIVALAMLLPFIMPETEYFLNDSISDCDLNKDDNYYEYDNDVNVENTLSDQLVDKSLIKEVVSNRFEPDFEEKLTSNIDFESIQTELIDVKSQRLKPRPANQWTKYRGSKLYEDSKPKNTDELKTEKVNLLKHNKPKKFIENLKMKHTDKGNKHNKKLKDGDNHSEMKHEYKDTKKKQLKKWEEFLNRKAKQLKEKERKLQKLEKKITKEYESLQKFKKNFNDKNTVKSNKFNISGEWYSNLYNQRNKIRKQEEMANWIFDRAEMRNRKRNKAHWYFNWMTNREELRSKKF